MYLQLCCLLRPRPLSSDDTCALVAVAYLDSGYVSVAVHSNFAEVDWHFDSEVVGEVAVADSAVVAAWVGSELLADSVEVAYCHDPCCSSNLSSCGP